MYGCVTCGLQFDTEALFIKHLEAHEQLSIVAHRRGQDLQRIQESNDDRRTD